MTRRMAASMCVGCCTQLLSGCLKVISRDGSRVALSRCQDIEAQTVKTEDGHGVVIATMYDTVLEHANM